MIPKIVHLCFGMDPSFGGIPWSLVHYVCVRSVKERIRPDEIFFYYQYLPEGPWWHLTAPLVRCVPIVAPTVIAGNPLLHPAHRADVVRLEKLIELGGIYVDCDVLVLHSFDSLLANACVIGQQASDTPEVPAGLCNAVLLAEPRASFLLRWHDAYASFRSRGRDQYWDEHSVRLPWQLALKHPNEITVLPFDAFHWPTWTERDLALIYRSTDSIDTPRTLAHHLWETLAWHDFLEGLDVGDVRQRDSNFHRWARPLLADLPDDFARLDVAQRVRLTLRRAGRRVRRAAARISGVQ